MPCGHVVVVNGCLLSNKSNILLQCGYCRPGCLWFTTSEQSLESVWKMFADCSWKSGLYRVVCSVDAWDVCHVILVSRHWNGSPPFAILPSCTFPCLRKRQIQIQIQKKGRKQGKKHAKWLPCNKSIFIFAPCSFLYALKIYQILYFVKYYKGTLLKYY